MGKNKKYDKKHYKKSYWQVEHLFIVNMESYIKIKYLD